MKRGPYQTTTWKFLILETNAKFGTCFTEIGDTLCFLKDTCGSAKAIARKLGAGVISYTSINRKFRELGIPVNKRGGANHIRIFPIDMGAFVAKARARGLTSREISNELKMQGITLSRHMVRYHTMTKFPSLRLEKHGPEHIGLLRSARRLNA